MTTVAASHPYTARRVLVRAVASVLLLGGAAGGVYEGAQALATHFYTHSVEVSYASEDHLVSTLQKANHSAAGGAGSFIDPAPLSAAYVRGVHVDTGE